MIVARLGKRTSSVTVLPMKLAAAMPGANKAIKSIEGAPRNLSVPTEERTKLRKNVEDGPIKDHRYLAQIPQGHKDKLVCWMEI